MLRKNKSRSSLETKTYPEPSISPREFATHAHTQARVKGEKKRGETSTTRASCMYTHTNTDTHTNRRRLGVILFQEDKDLVHEFVQNDGLACLIKVGSEADQNYQNYILRGEYMLSRLRAFIRTHTALSFLLLRLLVCVINARLCICRRFIDRMELPIGPRRRLSIENRLDPPPTASSYH